MVERGAFRLGPVDLEIGWAERVAILGENGAGKTTLLDALLGRTELTAGESLRRPRRGGGRAVASAGTASPPSSSLFEVMSDATGQQANEVRSLLAKFGLGAEHVAQAVAACSRPGERTRANLALFMAEGVNCLILDEPTNHLDLVAIEQLEQALDRFVGTVLLVSHDRAFLERVRTTRQIRVADGQVATASN